MLTCWPSPILVVDYSKVTGAESASMVLKYCIASHHINVRISHKPTAIITGWSFSPLIHPFIHSSCLRIPLLLPSHLLTGYPFHPLALCQVFLMPNALAYQRSVLCLPVLMLIVVWTLPVFAFGCLSLSLCTLFCLFGLLKLCCFPTLSHLDSRTFYNMRSNCSSESGVL